MSYAKFTFTVSIHSISFRFLLIFDYHAVVNGGVKLSLILDFIFLNTIHDLKKSLQSNLKVTFFIDVIWCLLCLFCTILNDKPYFSKISPYYYILTYNCYPDMYEWCHIVVFIFNSLMIDNNESILPISISLLCILFGNMLAIFLNILLGYICL